MDDLLLGHESDSEPMSADMLEEICDRRQSHMSINMREVRYKIRDQIKKRRAEWKGALSSTQKIR